MEFVEGIPDVLDVVVHLIVFKERLVFSLQHALFIIVITVGTSTRTRGPLDDRTEQLENVLLDLTTGCVLGHDEQATLRQRLLRLPEHIATALLGDHELHSCVFIHGACVVWWTLKCRQFEVLVKISNLKVILGHPLDLVVLGDADDWNHDVI